MHLGATCGLCGTCTKDPSDDFLLPSGDLADNAMDFGNAWATDSRECIEDNGEEACEEDSEEEVDAKDTCSVLTSPVGPFSQCHGFANPDNLFETCVYDVCAAGTNEVFCSNLRKYAEDCIQAGGTPGEWWNSVPECGSICPDNMIYDPCDSACQPTCAGGNDEDCKFTCEEVCKCPDGQLVDGDECVPEADCGCTLPGGAYIKRGEEWYSEDCSERCLCLDTGADCNSYSCPDTSVCDVRDGLRKCYCPSQYVMVDEACRRGPCVCNVYGDPHYTTFDKLSFDYQGDCEYILVQKCSTSTNVPNFKLVGRHSRDAPSDKVSYLRYLRFEYGGNDYEVFIAGKVKVNSRLVNVPYEDEELGITIGNQVYGFTTIAVEGLFIMYDNLQNAEIHVHAELEGQVCGMCGTCSDSQSDELQMPNGDIASSITEFGAAWRNDMTCETEGVTENPCVIGSLEDNWAKDMCNLLIQNSGPFAPCYEFVDPQVVYDACVMDLCVSLKPSFSCYIMKIYAQQCRQAGGNPGDWRKDAQHCFVEGDDGGGMSGGASRRRRATGTGPTVRDDECPDNSFLFPWGEGCQPTCNDRDGTENCQPDTLIETCICANPLVLYNDECIDPADCGCTSPGNDLMEVGDTWISDTCDQKCVCTDTGRECSDFSCGEHALCEIKGGVRNCYCQNGYTGDGQTCTGDGWGGGGSGDPHFRTFDQRKYDFMGTCEYTLVQLCGVGEALPYFQLIGNFNKPTQSHTVSVIVSVRLEYHGHVYEIRGPKGTLIDDETVTTPVTIESVTISYANKDKWTLTTDFGMVLTASFNYWGGSGTPYAAANVNLPPEFKGRTCGLLGTATGSTGDDFQMPNGELAGSVSEFANSWQTGDRECQPPKEEHPCPEGTDDYIYATDKCWVIIDPFGPLEDCRDFTNPDSFYDDCVYDVCRSNLETTHVCRNIEAYVELCRARGGNPGKWWTYVPECGGPCDEGTVYNDCGSACPPTCQHPDGTPDCPSNCIEVCECPEGQILDGATCVFPYNCGCTLSNGVYIPQGGIYTYPDCSIRCTCFNGEEQCVPLGCRTNEVCKIMGGIRGCYCEEGTAWNGKYCTDKPCSCSIWGDPHYLSFDGVKFDFQGDCEYTLVEACNQGSLPSFIVVGNNDKNKPSDPVSYLRGVRLEYQGTDYQMLSNGNLEVNGVIKTLPFSTGGDEHVTVTYVPQNKMVMYTHFGLEMIYSFDRGSVDIDVSPDYYEKLCGMCGTCNLDSSDDFTLPSQELASSAADFGNGWAIETTGCSPDPGTDPCEPGSDEEVAAGDTCAIITAEGPFSTCREEVDATPYFETCTYDVCVTGDVESFCDVVYQFSSSCINAGIDPGEWWQLVTECGTVLN
ncbi:putative IgGFc-binding protein [Apostichopus japonicus]|uniref:Putative IgGFc-binding protein n=1 Tax=Stichopus japonicus TaxID=307972 RepID=A0A2G8KYT0_STIJA|nr:putative IgGFc-binding protein [Apostichopus japonicus]